MNVFLARRTKEGIADHFFLGLSGFTHGLEDEGGIYTTQKCVKKREVNVEVSIAAVWMVAAGSWIYEQAKKDGGLVVFGSQSARKKPGRWQGLLGSVDLEKWDLWKSMFACIEMYYSDLNKDAKDMAQQPARVMDGIEMKCG